MIQGTTPTFMLTLPSQVDMNMKDIIFTISQGNVVISKSRSRGEVVIDKHTVYVKLNQVDSLRLKVGTADVQLNWTYEGVSDDRECSEICTVDITRNLYTGVMV